MSLENIANEDLTLGHDIDSADLSVGSLPSTKYKTNGKGIYSGAIAIIVANATKGSCFSGVGSVIINSSGKIKNNAQSVLREGDQGSGIVVGTDGNNPCNINITVDIDSAGQSKYKSE